MSPLPYLPGGVAELPASRFVLFADESHLIQRIDESAKTLNGVSFVGFWESGSLNKTEKVERTINYLTIVYQSPIATTATIRASGDGGETWAQSKTMLVEASAGDQIRRAQIGVIVTGFDIRIRIELDTDEVFTVLELHPILARRGEYVSG